MENAACRCADVVSIGLKPPFYEDLQFLISQYFSGMSRKGPIKLNKGLPSSVMGKVVPRHCSLPIPHRCFLSQLETLLKLSLYSSRIVSAYQNILFNMFK